MSELRLPRHVETVGAACEHAEAVARAAGWADADVQRVGLAVGEAVGNAVEHADGDQVRLTLDLDGPSLSICVDDGGPGPDAQQLAHAALPDDPLATGGRGLYILQHVADEVRVDEHGALCVTLRPRA